MKWPWDHLLGFLIAARRGSLTRAARELGVSQPTLSRRIDALERGIGAPLLERNPRGCTPTPLGVRLLPHIEQMRLSAEAIHQVVQARKDEVTGTVRVACGPLIGRMLARHIGALVDGTAGLQIEIASSTDFVSLQGGEADIALRNQRPTSPSLIARRLDDSRFAIYGAPPYVDTHPHARTDERFERCRWVGYVAGTRMPSAEYLRRMLGREPDVRMASSLTILEAAAAGAGLCVLPLYVGDDEPRLSRVSEPLGDELRFESYLVFHESTRHQPRIRWVADRLLELMASIGKAGDRGGTVRGSPA